MDIYPESELWQERLKIQKAHDEVMDKIGLNPYDGNNIL
jgi:toxin-antitoxin system, antitoxin component, xre family